MSTAQSLTAAMVENTEALNKNTEALQRFIVHNRCVFVALAVNAACMIYLIFAK